MSSNPSDLVVVDPALAAAGLSTPAPIDAGEWDDKPVLVGMVSELAGYRVSPR